MIILTYFPIQSILFFSIAPIIGALIGRSKAKKLKAKGDAQAGNWEIFKGMGIGLLIDIPFLIIIVMFFSVY